MTENVVFLLMMMMAMMAMMMMATMMMIIIIIKVIVKIRIMYFLISRSVAQRVRFPRQISSTTYALKIRRSA